MTAAARLLDIHPTTLRYHVGRIEARAEDLDLDDPEQRMVMMLLLRTGA